MDRSMYLPNHQRIIDGKIVFGSTRFNLVAPTTREMPIGAPALWTNGDHLYNRITVNLAGDNELRVLCELWEQAFHVLVTKLPSHNSEQSGIVRSLMGFGNTLGETVACRAPLVSLELTRLQSAYWRMGDMGFLPMLLGSAFPHCQDLGPEMDFRVEELPMATHEARVVVSQLHERSLVSQLPTNKLQRVLEMCQSTHSHLLAKRLQQMIRARS